MSNLITDIQTHLNEDLIKKIESFIKCPRCKQNIKCIRRKGSTTNKNKYKGVCDHCVNEYLFKTNKVRTDKKISGRGSPTKNYHKDKVKLWLSKVVDLLENNMILLKAANLSKHARRRVMLSTEKGYSMYENSKRVPYTTKVAQMFESTDYGEEGPTETSSNLKSRKRGISYDDDVKYKVDKIFVDRKQKQYLDNSVFSSKTSVSELTISSIGSYHKRSASLHHKLHILKKDLSDERHTPVEKLQYSSSHLYEEKYTHIKKSSKEVKKEEIKNIFDDSDIIHSKPIKKVKRKSGTTLRKSFSAEPLQSSIADLEHKNEEQNFSYFFPKEEQMKKSMRRHKSSSEIIKEVMDMLSTRAEFEKIKKEKERKKKLEEQDQKKQTLIEHLRPDEKQKEAPQTGETETFYKRKLINIDDKRSLKSKSTKSDVNTKIEKSARDKEKQKEKDDKEERLRLEKERKNKEKAEKDERLKLEKEKKLKEKADKEERSKLDKEMKMKEKADKEERMKMEQEKKLKDKDEKELLKKQKPEQIMKEKEPIKQKEEKVTKPSEKEPINQKEEKVNKPSEKEPIKQKEEKVTKPTLVKEKTELKPDIDTAKLLAQAKAKEEEMKKKKQQEEESKKMKQLPEQKLRDEANLNTKQDKPKKAEEKEAKPKSPEEKSPKEQPKTKELNLSKIKLRKPSPDDLILRLVRIKKAQDKKRKKRPTRLSDLDVSNAALKAHKGHQFRNVKNCMICQDSDLQLDIDNILYNDTNYMKTETNIIIGEKICKNRLPCSEKPQADKAFEPILFKTQFHESPHEESIKKVIEKDKQINVPIKQTEQEVSKGVIRYALSDRTFIEKGWTMLPTEKVVRKMNVYRMRPAHPEFDWFEHNKNKKIMSYDSGEKLAEFDDTGKGRWFYRNGRKALDYYDAEEINAQQRIIIYSNGEPDERGRGRPYTILATFDYLGNGIVFDHTGKIRLKYNQTEGVVLDRNIGPVSHWKWHTLNDPPVLQQVMIDTQMAHKDPDILKLGGPADDKTRHDNEEMLAIEFDNFIKEKSKKLSQKFKPFQIKMKALKINENFSLKVLDQATVYLIFRDGSTNLKLNIGMILDHKEIVDTDTAEVGVVSNSLERFPARTDSLAGLQQSVAHSQRIERARVERDRRIRPTQSCASADKLTAAASKPLRHPFRTAPSDTTTTCHCRCRKPSSNHIYYDTRLI